MNIDLITKDELMRIMESIDRLSEEVTKLSPNPNHIILTNEQFCELMNISKKTAQKWRDDGTIRFSQIGRSIYYRMQDVIEMLNQNYVD